MDENGDIPTGPVYTESVKPPEDEAIDVSSNSTRPADDKPSDPAAADMVDGQMLSGAVRTLDGEIAGDEFAGDAVNYQILLGKIEGLLARLKLDA